MKIALPVWNDRISPVFDTARRLLIVNVKNGKEESRTEMQITELHPPLRVRQLAETGAKVLICGAISRPLAAMIKTWDMAIVQWISGDVEEVLQAYFSGAFPEPRFLMPGCGGGPCRNRFRGGPECLGAWKSDRRR